MDKSSHTILIADGDTRNSHLLQRYLQAEGFEALVVHTEAELLRQLEQKSFDLLILDRALPDAGGSVACQNLRQKGHSLPVLMLLARGDDTRSFVNAKVGANACVRKSQSPLRLFTRVQNLLGLDEVGESERAAPISFGAFEFDVVGCSLSKAGKPVPLTSGDCSMLRALALRPHQLLERETLSLLARGRLYEPFDRSLDVQISRLRKLIEEDNRSPRYLQTVWGSGYMFVPEGRRQTDKITKTPA